MTDPQAFRPLRTTLALLTAVRRLWPKDFAWRDPPYEYEAGLPVDGRRRFAAMASLSESPP